MAAPQKIKEIPREAGVYFFKDREGRIIYIGKAADLKKRVQSHFARQASIKTGAMIKEVSDIDYSVTGTPEEALLYENHLIKKYKPKFNVSLRDDKSYPFLKLSISEEFPRLFITRRKKDDSALYFGPFTNAGLLKRALGLMRKIFPLRTCKTIPKKACLNYHIKQCLGPCIEKISKDEYWQIVKDVILFLEGEKKQLIKRLRRRMKFYSEAREFEKAGFVRDQIESLVSLTTPEQDISGALEELRELLHLKHTPKIIETFDISNYAGKEAVGALVCFVDGKPKKSNYRRFKIKTVKQIDDYAMMREVIRRRVYRLIRESRGQKPDLFIIDGGRGHLSTVQNELKETGIIGIKVAAIAKENELLFSEAREEPIELFKYPRALFLAQRMRDEAHRFAITYHHKLRSRSVRLSVLDEIPGVGEERKRILLQKFGSVDKIRKAGAEKLSKLTMINEKLARRIIEYLKT